MCLSKIKMHHTGVHKVCVFGPLSSLGVISTEAGLNGFDPTGLIKLELVLRLLGLLLVFSLCCGQKQLYIFTLVFISQCFLSTVHFTALQLCPV